MIKVTDEMIAVFQRESGYGGDLSPDSAHAGITAVLAIVERDLSTPAYRCQAWLSRDLRCELARGHERERDHLAQALGGESVTW